ncbi:pinopsin-like [Branchiostoma floridae]|uniref:Opsin-3 n=1 Tax=Branchiostoma floridae TaxID=7739 RepID=A0A455ZBY2_BRAFL|nr:pinopsin-like [Branchiostoma floridae]DAC74046.1 TPA_exp: C-type opsin [Branchiostoma floridae]
MALYNNTSSPFQDILWDAPYSQGHIWDNSSTSNATEDVMGQGKVELQDFSDSGYTTIATCLALIGFVGFTNNFVVILLIGCHRQLRTPFNLLLLNMSVADLLVSVCGNTLSFASAVRHRWLWGRPGCVWYGFANSLFGIVSLVTLSALAFERYCVVVRSSDMLTYKSSLGVITFIWLYSLLWTSLPLLGWSSYQFEGHNVGCSVNWVQHNPDNVSYIVTLMVTCFFVPMVVVCWSYAWIWRTVRMSSEAKPEYGNSQNAGRLVTTMVVVMIICFLVCWTPYAVMALIVTFGADHLVTPTASVIPSLVAKSSTAYNPIIYVLMNNQFREFLLARLQRVCCRQQAVPRVTPLDYNVHVRLGGEGPSQAQQFLPAGENVENFEMLKCVQENCKLKADSLSTISE